MNDVAKTFSKSTTLLCEYHVLKNVRARCKLDHKVKDPRLKEVKLTDLGHAIMYAWKVVVNSICVKLYVDIVLQ